MQGSLRKRIYEHPQKEKKPSLQECWSVSRSLSQLYIKPQISVEMNNISNQLINYQFIIVTKN